MEARNHRRIDRQTRSGAAAHSIEIARAANLVAPFAAGSHAKHPSFTKLYLTGHLDFAGLDRRSSGHCKLSTVTLMRKGGPQAAFVLLVNCLEAVHQPGVDSDVVLVGEAVEAQ